MLKEKSSSELIFSPIIQAPDRNSANLAIESIFSKEYTFLRPYYLPAWPAFNRIKQNKIQDRQWLKDEVNFFLSEMDRGLIVLEGQEGTGKTTFLTQLAYELCSIHHFITLPQVSKGLQLARINIAAQIIREWDLLDWIPPDHSPEVVFTQGFLNDLFLEASRRNENSSLNRKMIIILDGLDELGVTYDLKSLDILKELPKNVYFIISHSPDQEPFILPKTAQIIYLGQESSKQTSDLLAYCQKRLEDPSYNFFLDQVEIDQMVQVLVGKSNGNWLLLDFLLQQIKDHSSKISIEEIQSRFPDNLFAAYLSTFLNLKDKDHAEWYRYILPVLGVLSAYPEPISRNQLTLTAGLPADLLPSNQLLDQVLDHFLNIDLQGRYQFNHPSLRTFLSGGLTKKDLSLQEEAFAQEISENCKQYHLRFAQKILSAWGKIDEGLPGLRKINQLTPQDQYGLNYLPCHLEGSGAIDDLQKLLLIEWPPQKDKRPQAGLKLRTPKKNDAAIKEAASKLSNGWYEIKFSFGEVDSYLDDIQRAWKNSPGIEEHILYALITSSVISSQSINGELTVINDQEEQEQFVARLAASLAELDDSNAALSAVELLSTSRWKNQAYAEITPYLPSQSIPIVIRYCQQLEDNWGKDQIFSNCALRLTELSKPVQAFEIANQLSSDSLRNQLFAQMAKNLIEANQVEMALEAIHHITNESLKTDLLVEFSKTMDRDALQISLSLIRGFHDQSKKSMAISGLAPYLPNALQRDCIQWLDQLNEENRSKVLAGLIPHMRETLLKDALSAARDIKDETLRAPVLVELSIRTAATGEPGKALKLMQAILGENFKASAVQGITPFLTDEQRYETLGVIQAFKDLNSKNRAYDGLIPFLYDPILTDIMEKAQVLKPEGSQSTIYKAVAKRYLELGEAARSIEIIKKCTTQEVRAKLLMDLAPLWPEALRSEILTLTLALDDPELLASALAGFLPFLGHTALLDALYIVIQLPAQGWLGVNHRAELLNQMCSLLVQRGDVERSFAILREFTDDESISKGLVITFPHIPDESQATTLAFIQRIQDPLKRSQTLVTLMPMLSASLIDNVLGYLENLDDEKLRLSVLIRLAPKISPDKFPGYIKSACQLQGKSFRAQAFAALIPNWLLLPVSQSLGLWKELILVLSRRSRPDLLLDLKSLAPVISDLGGISAINTTIKSIRDVAKWWN
jgi:hypothetical protein